MNKVGYRNYVDKHIMTNKQRILDVQKKKKQAKSSGVIVSPRQGKKCEHCESINTLDFGCSRMDGAHEWKCFDCKRQFLT